MAKEAALKKDLGLFQVTLAGTGVIIGAGIYALLGVASASAGNAIWLSFLIGAVIATLTGLSYAELSSMFKGDAGEYDYVKSAFTKRIGFWVAIAVVFGTMVSSAAVALGFGRYLSSLVPVNVVAGAFILIITMGIINLSGIKETEWYNDFGNLVELTGLLAVIVLGFSKIGSVNLLEMPFGLTGVFSASALVFFAYLGFEGVVKLRDEAKNPEKTVPKGMLLAILISSILYVLVAISAVSIVGWQVLSKSNAPMALVASTVLGSRAFIVLAIIALFSTSNTVLMTMVAASRQLYGMAKEHSLPGRLSHVNPKTQTPTFAILLTIAIGLLFATIGNISFVANFTDLFLLLAFAVVNVSLIILRYKYPNMHRGFRCPGNLGNFSVVAFFGAITSIGLAVFVVMNLV